MHLLLCLSHSHDTQAYGSCISQIITRNDYTCAMCLRIKQRENAWNIFIQCTHQTKKKHAKNLRNAVLLWLSQCFGYFNPFLNLASECFVLAMSVEEGFHSLSSRWHSSDSFSGSHRLKISASHIISF